MKVTQKCDEVKVVIYDIGSAAKAILVSMVLFFVTRFLFANLAVMLLNPMQHELALLDRYDDGECDRCELPNATRRIPCSRR